MKTPESSTKLIVRQLADMMDGSKAHATFIAATKDFPAELRGTVPEGLPYSAWQIVEHIRIAQKDILEYCNNEDGSYKPMDWPKDYWPEKAAPPNEEAWGHSVQAVLDDRKDMEKLLTKADADELVKPFPWGEGQTLLKEALLVIDHCGYHVGELVVLRRLLGAWKA